MVSNSLWLCSKQSGVDGVACSDLKQCGLKWSGVGWSDLEADGVVWSGLEQPEVVWSPI